VPPDLFPAVGADEELLRRHVAGDPDASASLVGRRRDRIWGGALLVDLPPTAAEPR
jgi:RNA polymerase sigma-70 factor (ECF subfamily)